MILTTNRGLIIGTQVSLIRPDAIVAEWTHRSITPNEQFLYVAAKYVEADKPNENKHFWSFEALQDAQSTIRNSPINVMHQGHNIIGVMTDSEMIYPEAVEGRYQKKDGKKPPRKKKAAAFESGDHLVADMTAEHPEMVVDEGQVETVMAYDYAKPYIEMLGALWKWYFPKTIAQVEAAQEMGALWASMECRADTVTRVDNDGSETNYEFLGGNIKAYDFHEDSSHVRLNDPHFTGCGLVLPPGKPGWKGAEVRDLIAAHDEDEQERLYQEIADQAPHLSAEQWEDLMITVLANGSEQ